MLQHVDSEAALRIQFNLMIDYNGAIEIHKDVT